MEDRLNTFRPHDLLLVSGLDAFSPIGSAPVWLAQHWTTTLPVVVRREQTSHDIVAVGIRGSTRDQRLAGYVNRDAVVRCVRPENLVQTRLTGPAHYPCLVALQT